MQNYVDFWNEKLHLDEFKKLLTNIYEGREQILSETNVLINDKQFTISLNNTNEEKVLNIKCSDGRELSIYLNLYHLSAQKFYYENYRKNMDQGSWFIYKLNGKELRFMSNSLGDYPGIRYSNIDNAKLINKITVDVSKKRKLQFVDMNFFNYIQVSPNCCFSNYYYFDEFGIYEIYDDMKYMISLDGEKVINVDGKKIPDHSEVKSFDPIKELELFKNFVKNNQSDLQNFDEEVIDSLKDGLNKKRDFYKKISFYLEYHLSLVKEAIKAYHESLDSIGNYVFTQEELVKHSEVLNELLNDKIDVNENSETCGKVKLLKKNN